MMIRIWIKAVDADGEDTGYLMPIGAELFADVDGGLRQTNSGLIHSDNRPTVLEIGGVAANAVASPTDAQVATAQENLKAFFLGTNNITDIYLVDHTDVSPLGATVASLPGTEVEHWETAYTSGNPRWEVLDLTIDSTTFPSNFDFTLTIQNFPLGDIERQPVGKLKAFGATLSRDYVNGMETNALLIDLHMPNGGNDDKALEMLRALVRQGGQDELVARFGSLTLQGDFAGGGTTTVYGVLAGSRVQRVAFDFDRVEKRFRLAIHFDRLGHDDGKSTGGLNPGEVEMLEITITANVRRNLAIIDRKRKNARKIVQRTANPDCVFNVNVSASAYLVDMPFDTLIRTFVSHFDDEKYAVTVYSNTRGSGEKLPLSVEKNNNQSFSMEVILLDPEVLNDFDGGATVVGAAGGRQVIPDNISDALALATLSALGYSSQPDSAEVLTNQFRAD